MGRLYPYTQDGLTRNWANYKDFLMLDLQTARFRTLDELETWDLDEIHRLD